MYPVPPRERVSASSGYESALAGRTGKQMKQLVFTQRPSPALSRYAAVGLCTALVSACASTKMEAQWRDPQLAPQSLQGKTVLVVCRGLDFTLERICEDKLTASVQAMGVKVTRSDQPPPTGAAPADALLYAAKVAGAEVVLSTTLEPAGYDVAPSGGSVG